MSGCLSLTDGFRKPGRSWRRHRAGRATADPPLLDAGTIAAFAANISFVTVAGDPGACEDGIDYMLRNLWVDPEEVLAALDSAEQFLAKIRSMVDDDETGK